MHIKNIIFKTQLKLTVFFIYIFANSLINAIELSHNDIHIEIVNNCAEEISAVHKQCMSLKEIISKIKDSITQTDGEIIRFNNELIKMNLFLHNLYSKLKDTNNQSLNPNIDAVQKAIEYINKELQDLKLAKYSNELDLKYSIEEFKQKYNNIKNVIKQNPKCKVSNSFRFDLDKANHQILQEMS
jgi:chromosome segregation ATPase